MLPVNAMEAYPKPRNQYIYNPRYGQRGFLSYAGQTPNGAAPAGVIGGGYGVGYAGVGVGMGVGYAAGAYQPAVYQPRSYYPQTYVTNYYPQTYASNYSYPSYGYGSYYNYGLYGSMYPLANFYYPYQRSYYNTVPSYGYTAHVYPPATATTTYHVTNSQTQQAFAAPATRVVRETRPAYAHGHMQQGLTREDIQMENRRVATERGAYDARKIRPADARDDDPFWCREVNGEWHLRSYYQIENECNPGRWMMDAEAGFLVFHRA
jgi:F0F1-type ATP synthase membrane subunit c/vacuolar-type H+-ATPase subunit K